MSANTKRSSTSWVDGFVPRLERLGRPEGSSVEEHTKLEIKQKRLLTVVLQLMKNFMEEQILFAFYPDFPPKR
ncbi:hypothetical protein T01_6641 [Trichinella spiralis]|uniref:Uncharacterized protein n=1 Tax=Trichinella spiralis TaxID=6334 RepID=A0A0V1B1Y1_TRISP|nr:hypothetical protein T01_6641 [Trichinella spiralis]